MPETKQLRDPVRPVDQEFLSRLELVSDKRYPLPGGNVRRAGQDVDPRLTHANPMLGVKQSDEITMYEHVATVRWKAAQGQKDQFYVMFQETMDALMIRQKDPESFPEWLIKDPRKKTELSLYVYRVTRHPKEVPIIRSLEDWLEHVSDPRVFDAVVYYLLHRGIVKPEMIHNV